MTKASSSSFHEMTASALIHGYAAGTFSPVEVMAAALERAHTHQARLNCFSLIDDEGAMDMARSAEKRWLANAPLGLLDGVPVAIKDTSDARGWPTRFGSLSGLKAQPASEDAPLVSSLRQHGAAFIGKTATPEFAWKGVTDSALQGITRNPWNTDLTPGGSSGGSAAAVAAGIVPIATGADGGGSLRIPASFCGIYGLKPTAGLIPALPTPLGSVAVVGGLTRTAEDMGLFLNASLRPDPRDSFAIPDASPILTSSICDGVQGLKIGFSETLGFGAADPEVQAALLNTVSQLRSMGACVEPVDLDLSAALPAFETIWALSFNEILDRLAPDVRDTVEPALLAIADRSQTISGREAQAATRLTRSLSMQMSRYFTQYDLLLTPAMPSTAFNAGLTTPDPERYPNWWNWTPYTWPFNLSRNPAISCPAGFSRAGMPIGMQFVGRWFDESLLLRAAQALS